MKTYNRLRQQVKNLYKSVYIVIYNLTEAGVMHEGGYINSIWST